MLRAFLVFVVSQTGPASAPEAEPLLVPPPPAADRIGGWDDALARLRAHGPDLKIALAGLERARADARLALAALLPSLAATASAQQTLVGRRGGNVMLEGGGGNVSVGGDPGARGTPTSPLGVLRATAALPIVDVAAWRRRGAAAEGVRAAGLALGDVRRRALQALARALVALVTAERVAELSRAGLADAHFRHRLTTEAERLGAGTRLDALRTARDLGAARAEVIAANEAVLQAQEAIGLALGQGRPVGLAPGFRLDRLAAGAGGCRPARGSPRDDVAAAEAAIARAGAEIAGARAAYVPTLTLQSTATALTVDPGLARLNTWNVALVLGLPVWDGGERGARLRAAEAARAEAAGQRDATSAAAAVEIGRARRTLGVAERLVAATRQARDAAAEADLLTRESYTSGIGTSLELVDSAVARREAERALALRELELVEARIDALLAEATCAP